MKMPKSVVLATLLFPLLCAVSAFAQRLEKSLLLFNGVNGAHPQGMSIDADGNLWVVAGSGGLGGCEGYEPGCGTVVEFTPVSGRWRPRVVYKFKGGNDGSSPVGNLAFDTQGNVYGETVYGGTAGLQGAGTVFRLTPVSGGWEESVIYRFNLPGTQNDGWSPSGGMIIDAAGNLYGVTEQGGNQDGDGQCPYGCGTAFELSPTGNDNWTETILYNFGKGSADGVYPLAPIVFDAQGNLYGTTPWGGSENLYPCNSAVPVGCGVVFQLSPNSSGGWTEAVIHNFGSFNGDGLAPWAGLVLDADGNLYGTTVEGGFGNGTVFRLMPSSGGNWVGSVLYAFPGDHGAVPTAGVTFDNAGNLYGTTWVGGVYGEGTAFKLSPTLTGEWKETVLHSFGNGQDGRKPATTLVMETYGNLYGVASFGGIDATGPCTEYGIDGCGTVFEIVP
jgi:uncharacterized repeat protein (TIGR03803 family)